MPHEVSLLVLLTGVSALAWSVATEAELKPRYNGTQKPSIEVNLNALYRMQGTPPATTAPRQIAPPAAQMRPSVQMSAPIARPAPTQAAAPVPRAIVRNTDDMLKTLLTPAPKPTVHYKQPKIAAPRHLSNRYGRGKPIPTMPPALPYQAGKSTPSSATYQKDEKGWWDDTTEFARGAFDLSDDVQEAPAAASKLPSLPVASAPAAPIEKRYAQRPVLQPITPVPETIAVPIKQPVAPIAMPKIAPPPVIAQAPTPAPTPVPIPTPAAPKAIAKSQPLGNAARYDGYELAEALIEQPVPEFKPTIRPAPTPLPAPTSPGQETLLAEISDTPQYSAPAPKAKPMAKAAPAPTPIKPTAAPMKIANEEEQQPWFNGLKQELASYFDSEEQAQTQSKQMAKSDNMLTPVAANPSLPSLVTSAPAISNAPTHLPSLSKLNGDAQTMKEAAQRRVNVLSEPRKMVTQQAAPVAAEPKVVQSKVRVKRIIPKALTRKPETLTKAAKGKASAAANTSLSMSQTKPAPIAAVKMAEPKAAAKIAEPKPMAKKPEPKPMVKIAKPKPVVKRPEAKVAAHIPTQPKVEKAIAQKKSAPMQMAKAEIIKPAAIPAKVAAAPEVKAPEPAPKPEPIKKAATAPTSITPAPASPVKAAQKEVMLSREEKAPAPTAKTVAIAEPAALKPVEKVVQLASLPKASAPKTVSSSPASATQSQIDFNGSDTALNPALRKQLNSLASDLKSSDTRRLNIRAFAAAEKGQEVLARRIALARGLAVRAYLIEQGVNALRINVQSIGNKDGNKTPNHVLLEVKELGGA